MAATKLAPPVALAALLLTGSASAKVYVEWRPRISLMGGYNDNVLLNGTGADAFGQAQPGLKLDLFGDHGLHLAADCQAGFARLLHPEQFQQASGAFAANESCSLNTRVRLSTRDRLQVRSSATYAQDPFAIAGYGLLLRPGQNDVFVANFAGEIQHALSTTSEVDYGLDARALAFGAGDPGNGYVLAPQLRYAWRTSARSKWDVGVREQLFFGIGADPNPRAPAGVSGGLLDQAHSILLGYTYALTPYANLIVRGGGTMVTGDHQTAMPTGRIAIESYTPWTLLNFSVAHDLVIGPTSAGPIVGDTAELALIKDWEHFTANVRGGIYRNADVSRALELGALGYDVGAGVGWKLTRDLRVELAALRDARLFDSTAYQVDRNVVQMRLTWEKARFE
jgi:hypothetical protein